MAPEHKHRRKVTNIAGDGSTSGNALYRVWEFVKRQIIDEAPKPLAICEFDCRNKQCMQDKWDACERRPPKGCHRRRVDEFVWR
jgi:hypothetical protein